MADDKDGAPDPPKPAPASIPDLKKALENKPPPVVWSPGAPVARAAASVSAVSPRARAPTALERLTSTPGKLAVLAALMLLGGAGLSLTAFHDGAAGGGGLGGIKSTIKSRAFAGRDSTGFNKGYGAGAEAAAKGRMNFDLIKAGDAIPAAGGAAGAAGAVGDAPMNYDEGPAGRAGADSAGGAPGMGGAAEGDGEAGGSGGGAGGGAAPRLGSSYGKINFQGMRRVSGTAGFRGIQGRRGAPNKTIQTRGSSANSADAAGGRGAGSKGALLTPFSGNGPRAAAAGSGAKSGGSGSSAAGGGGGGGGSMDVEGLQDAADQTLPSVPDLMAQAASLREEADKEEKKAKILAAGGHLAQAHYHYDKAEKKKDQAKDLEAQAGRQLDALKDEAEGLTE